MEPSEIFRTQQRPCQIHQQCGGNNSAKNQIEHYTFSQPVTYRMSKAKTNTP
jgi:hypothetical protein